MSKPIIEVKNISKRYELGSIGTTRLRDDLEHFWNRLKGKTDRPTEGEFWALRDVSFEIHPGEIVGIIGRNGAGKSTLLKILSRITELTSGEILMRGRVASLLEVGTGFHGDLSGRENIFLNGAILGMTKAEIRGKLDEIVAFSEIEKFIDTPVKRYSSGMYVRLAFAVAAHLEPEILIVDEVLAVGDATFQQKCMGKMQSVSQQGRTILFVSHNITAINNLCSHGIYLKEGKMLTRGPVDDVVSKYLAGSRSILETPLKDRTDRQGAGEVRITGIHMEDDKGNTVERVASGATVILVVEYESRYSEQLKNVRVSLAVQNSSEQNLFLCSSELISPEARSCSPCGRIKCVIPKFPLSGGAYNLVAYFETGGTAQDLVSNAANLMVEDGDFYQSGKLYPPGWQGKGVLITHSWEWPSS